MFFTQTHIHACTHKYYMDSRSSLSKCVAWKCIILFWVVLADIPHCVHKAAVLTICHFKHSTCCKQMFISIWKYLFQQVSKRTTAIPHNCLPMGQLRIVDKDDMTFTLHVIHVNAVWEIRGKCYGTIKHATWRHCRFFLRFEGPPHQCCHDRFSHFAMYVYTVLDDLYILKLEEAVLIACTVGCLPSNQET